MTRGLGRDRYRTVRNDLLGSRGEVLPNKYPLGRPFCKGVAAPSGRAPGRRSFGCESKPIKLIRVQGFAGARVSLERVRIFLLHPGVPDQGLLPLHSQPYLGFPGGHIGDRLDPTRILKLQGFAVLIRKTMPKSCAVKGCGTMLIRAAWEAGAHDREILRSQKLLTLWQKAVRPEGPLLSMLHEIVLLI